MIHTYNGVGYEFTPPLDSNNQDVLEAILEDSGFGEPAFKLGRGIIETGFISIIREANGDPELIAIGLGALTSRQVVFTRIM